MKQAIIIEADELSEMIREAVTEAMASHEPAPQDQNKLLTRTETAQYLSVSLPTLNRYTASGRLRSRKIGGKVFFSMSDINAAMR